MRYFLCNVSILKNKGEIIMSVDLPDIITKLPEIEMPDDKIKGHLLQGKLNQGIFFDVKKGTRIPGHAHAAQWGIVIVGEFEVTIGENTKPYRKGDTYFIPENTVHSAHYVADTVTFDVFDDKTKFKQKK